MKSVITSQIGDRTMWELKTMPAKSDTAQGLAQKSDQKPKIKVDSQPWNYLWQENLDMENSLKFCVEEVSQKINKKS